MINSRKLRLIFLFLLLGCTMGCDQAVKRLARSELCQGGTVELPGGLIELRLAENPGAFLSLGASLPLSSRRAVFIGGAGAGLLALFGYLVSRARMDWLSFLGLTLVLAGGASNLIDRIMRQGLVTDFITLRAGDFHTGIFNLADLVLTVGVVLLVGAWWKRVPLQEPGPENSGS